ncbi:hypothetical protein Tco_1510471 [Tanacetum coccineum]
MEEVLLTINEVELKKMADEMLRQICTSGDEHQYHIDQMKNFLKSDIDLLYLKKGNSGPEKIMLSLHKFPAIIFNDVKYGYKQRDLTEDEVEYLKLFEEEIELRLKYRNQMRR